MKNIAYISQLLVPHTNVENATIVTICPDTHTLWPTLATFPHCAWFSMALHPVKYSHLLSMLPYPAQYFLKTVIHMP